MHSAKLKLMSSRKRIPDKAPRDWILHEGQINKIGNKKHSKDKIDIDLSFDYSVSRIHAEVYFDNDSWWIKDRSTYGTTLKNKKIAKNEKVKLNNYDEIVIGNNTVLVFTLEDRGEFSRCEIEVIAEESFYYALIHNYSTFIERITIYNRGDNDVPASQLRIALGGFWNKTISVPSLCAGAAFSVPKDELRMDPSNVEMLTETAHYSLALYLNDSLKYKKEVKILSYNAWSLENTPNHRTAIASFVLESHPHVVALCNEIVPKVIAQTKDYRQSVIEISEAFYDYFKKTWRIKYVNEPWNAEKNYQRIRLPHHILYNWNHHYGLATCIDMSLLFCAYCINLDLIPVLLLFELNSTCLHSLVGIREEENADFNHLIYKLPQNMNDFVLIDPVCVTENLNEHCQDESIINYTQKECSFECSKMSATKIANSYKFIFGIDIQKARSYNIKPLPISDRPKLQSLLQEAIDKAKQLVVELKIPIYSSAHLLLALFEIKAPRTIALFEKAGITVDDSISILKNKLARNNDIIVLEPASSKNFEKIFSHAEENARKKGHHYILEDHVLEALLLIESDFFKRILKDDLRVDLDTLKQMMGITNKAVNSTEQFYQ